MFYSRVVLSARKFEGGMDSPPSNGESRALSVLPHPGIGDPLADPPGRPRGFSDLAGHSAVRVGTANVDNFLRVVWRAGSGKGSPPITVDHPGADLLCV